MPSFKSRFIERLFTEYGGAMQAFFRRRVRTKLDAADLTQELYLRILRVREAEVILNPEAYLFTVASHLLKEHAVLERRRGYSVDLADTGSEPELVDPPRFEQELDQAARVRRLQQVLSQLSPRCQAVVWMAYQHEMSYQEIGTELGISANTVKKNLVHALAHCRQRMVRGHQS